MLLFPSELSLQVITIKYDHNVLFARQQFGNICTTIPTEARFDLLIRFRTYCDPMGRICFSHLVGNRLAYSVQ